MTVTKHDTLSKLWYHQFNTWIRSVLSRQCHSTIKRFATQFQGVETCILLKGAREDLHFSHTIDMVACVAHLRSTKMLVSRSVRKRIVVHGQITARWSGMPGICHEPFWFIENVFNTLHIAAQQEPTEHAIQPTVHTAQATKYETWVCSFRRFDFGFMLSRGGICNLSWTIFRNQT